MMDIVLHDLRHAARSLRRSMFFALTVLTLGLGIGVITALRGFFAQWSGAA